MVSTRSALLVLALAVSSVAGAMPQALKQRQASRLSVLERLTYREVIQARDPEPSPTLCYCSDGVTLCPDQDCPESCPSTPGKREIKRRASGLVHHSSFYGTFLEPRDAALFLARGGDFVHTNGTRIRDETYISNNIRLRSTTPRNYPLNRILQRAGEHFVRFSGRFLAKRLTKMFGTGEKARDLILPFSDEIAIRATDLVATARILLADESLEEINIYHHSEILLILCPRFGVHVCGGEERPESAGPSPTED
ncbi:hypothetical protein EXIGLDRAFT_755294 [Exidia glandulosa HHB12029]|uniref:Uncharacterized protein n=1 Tax=Exidia glandulosa HHB12029 TaxID=1314781 RepID=A0A165C5M8_EXIGL|nr:hypothetical protein EXIGLDRAFT_755294 [Exidia glandulosa HHB12029]